MIRDKLFSALLVLAVSAAPALAEIQFSIEEPAADSSRSGIGLISGWAVSDDSPIISVEVLIDGVSLGQVPYGGTRQDVALAFPDIPDAEFSGWAMKWNYSLLEPGEHTVTVVVTAENRTEAIKDVDITTTSFKSPFIADSRNVDISGAVLTAPDDGLIEISGAEIDGEIVDVELRWDTASQQFLISRIVRDEPVMQNQAPRANAGNDFSMHTRSTVNINGSAADSDGTIVAWRWQQVSGQSVSLQNTTTNQLRLTSGSGAGTVVLRLTVTDDDGAWDDDEVTVTINEPPPPANNPPTASAGPDKTVKQGENVTITGSAGDTDGTIEGWSWSRVSGPSVNLSNADQPTVSFTAPNTTGDIRLRLTVTDDDGSVGFDDVIITVESGGDGGDTTGGALQSMLSVLNAARGQAQVCDGVSYPPQPPFTWSSSLADIATQHSMDMAEQGYFNHTSADGTSMGDRVFPHWSGGNAVGENIAASSINRSDGYIVDLWLSSTEGHCEVIMDPDFTHIGVGYGRNDRNAYVYHHFWTLDFGGSK